MGVRYVLFRVHGSGAKFSGSFFMGGRYETFRVESLGFSVLGLGFWD